MYNSLIISKLMQENRKRCREGKNMWSSFHKGSDEMG